jgi:hypothetical protein
MITRKLSGFPSGMFRATCFAGVLSWADYRAFEGKSLDRRGPRIFPFQVGEGERTMIGKGIQS